MSTFNSYREWLGLDDHLAHPNYYELLGLRLDETNPQIISFSADKAIAQVRSQRPGLHVAEWSRLLDEIQTAKHCLLDDQKRREYDHKLGNVTPVPTNRGSAPANTPSQPGSYNAQVPKISGAETPAAANFYPPGFAPEQPIAAELVPPASLQYNSKPNYSTASITSIATAPMHGLYPPGNPLAEQPHRNAPAAHSSPPSSQPTASVVGHPAMNPMAPNVSNSPPHNPMLPSGGYGSAPPYSMTNVPPLPSLSVPHAMQSGPMAPTGYMQPTYNAPPTSYSPYAQPMGYASPMSPMSPAPMMGGPQNMHAPLVPPTAMPPYGASPYGAPPTAQPWNNNAPTPFASAYPSQIPHAAPVASATPFAPSYAIQPTIPATAPMQSAPPSMEAANSPIQGPSSYRPVRRQSSSIVPLMATLITGMLMAGGIVGALIYVNRPQRQIANQTPIAPPNQTITPPTPAVNIVKPEPKKEVPKPAVKNTEVVIKRPDAETKPLVKPQPETTPQPMPEKMSPPDTKPQPTPVPTPTPTPEPTMSAAPSAAELASLTVEMKNARDAFHEYNFAEGAKALEKAQQLAKLPEHKAKVERFARVAELAQRFRKAIVQTLGTLDAGDVIKIGSVAEIAVVEVAPDKLIVREQGMNNTYTLDSMKMGIALKLGEMSLNSSDPETRLAKGAYEFFDKKRDASPTTKQDKIKKVETTWKEAELMGADIGELIKVLTDTYEFTADKAT